MTSAILEEILEEVKVKFNKEVILSPLVMEKYDMRDSVEYAGTIESLQKKQGELDLYSKLKEKYSDVISEQPVMTYEEDGKVHVRWTDFYLPKENVLIEYLPIDEKDKGKIKWNFHPTPEEKKEIFEKNKIENIVYLYKSDLEEDKWNEKLEEKVGVKEGVVEEESKSFMGYVAGAIGAFFSIAASYIWFLAL